MSWLMTLGFSKLAPDDAQERERVRSRLLEQEQRVNRLTRAVEVIQRHLEEEYRGATPS